MSSPSSVHWQRRWAGPALILAVFIALLVWTWQRLADVLVDFGVQLYVPWQLAQGKVLYRDIAHYTGPLSVYFNALAFRMFGVSLRTLELANLPILIGIVIAIYWLTSRMAGRFCATVCGISFLTLFAFAHVSIAGNYNFVTPYEYEYTHATLLCLLFLIFLHRTVRDGRWIDSGMAGFLLGMIFLTRAEFFAAALGAAGVAFLLAGGRAAQVRRLNKMGIVGIFCFAMAVAPVVSACLLRMAMPWDMAIRGTLGMWPAMLRGNVSSQYFYHHSMGTDDIGRSLRLLAGWTLAWCIPVAGFASWAILPKPGRSTAALAIALFIGAIFVRFNWRHVDWISMFRPLPAAVAIIIAVSIVQFSRRTPGDTAMLAAIFGVFSLLLMGKIILYARIAHYGCWLAMPATMMVVMALFGWIPAWIGRRGGSGAAFVAGIGGAWIVVVWIHLGISATAMGRLTVSVGNGADQFWADSVRGNCVNNAVLLAQQIPPEKTLACFPEGIMINYLARRNAPTRFVNFNPPDLLLFGEDRMLQAMAASPPDYIFLVHKDTSEFGERFFGRDYGQKLLAWIEANYQEAQVPSLELGDEPLQTGRFGIRLLVPRQAEQDRRLIYGPSGGDSPRWIEADSISSTE